MDASAQTMATMVEVGTQTTESVVYAGVQTTAVSMMDTSNVQIEIPIIKLTFSANPKVCLAADLATEYCGQ